MESQMEAKQNRDSDNLSERTGKGQSAMDILDIMECRDCCGLTVTRPKSVTKASTLPIGAIDLTSSAVWAAEK